MEVVFKNTSEKESFFLRLVFKGAIASSRIRFQIQ